MRNHLTVKGWTTAQEKELLKAVKNSTNAKTGIEYYAKFSKRGLSAVNSKYYSLKKNSLKDYSLRKAKLSVKKTKKTDLFEIQTGIRPKRASYNSPLITKAVSTVLHMDPKKMQSFFIPNNKDNDIKIQSIYWSLRQQLKKVNKNIAIKTNTVGNTKNPSGIRIFRIN